MIQFHALGGLTVTDDGDEVSIGGPRQRRLLAMLLIRRNAVVSTDRLAEAVFAGEPIPAAGTTLRSYVARVRKVIDGVEAGAKLVTQAPGYQLRLADDAFDIARFERLVAGARSRLGRDDPAGATSVLHGALALWRGDAYAEFADEDWARPEAQRLEELRLVAQEHLVAAELAGLAGSPRRRRHRHCRLGRRGLPLATHNGGHTRDGGGTRSTPAATSSTSLVRRCWASVPCPCGSPAR